MGPRQRDLLLDCDTMYKGTTKFSDLSRQVVFHHG